MTKQENRNDSDDWGAISPLQQDVDWVKTDLQNFDEDEKKEEESFLWDDDREEEDSKTEKKVPRKKDDAHSSHPQNGKKHSKQNKQKTDEKQIVSGLSRGVLIAMILIVCLAVGVILFSALTKKNEEKLPVQPASASSFFTAPIFESLKYPKGTDPLTLGSITQLVNQNHGLPQDYEPADLVLNNLPAMRDTYLRSEAASALADLFAAAQKDGANLICCSGYRSYQDQVEVYANEVENIGEHTTKMTTAPPGFSEHQSGLCIDVTSNSVGQMLTTDFINTAEGKWLADHAWEYGFIIRYPNGMEKITGYTYEPWHIRYLGKKVAKSVYESGKTYEEYLGILD